MAVIAGISDLRGHGAPSDIGLFESSVNALTFRYTFSGVDYVATMSYGMGGWVLTYNNTYTPANVDSAVWAGLSNFTAGRTWKEKLVIKGDYVIQGGRGIFGYTEIEIVGKIRLVDSGGLSIWQASAGSTQIEIYGGELDGNGDNQDFDQNTLTFDQCTDCSVHHVKIGGSRRTDGSDGSNIQFEDCVDCGVSFCNFYSYSVGYDAIKFTDGCVTCSAIGNHVDSTATTTSGAIQLHLGNNNIVMGNTIKCSVAAGALVAGIKLHHDDYNIITGNIVLQARNSGISIIDTSSYNLITDNHLFDIWETGINVNEATGGNVGYYNTIKDNEIFMEGSYVGVARGIRVTTSGDHTEIFDNTIHGNLGVGNDVGIVIYAGAEDTILARNRVYNFSDVCTDAGTRTVFEQHPFSFTGVQGAATFTPTGIEISLATEGAYAYTYVPDHVQKVMNLKITGKTNLADADGMQLDIRYYAGADNEDISTHTEALANQSSTTKNFAVNDGIEWDVNTVTLQSIKGGDHFCVHVTYEAASAPDDATDMRAQACVIDIV